MTVSAGNNGGIVFYCHAGCKTENILSAIGLTFADVSPESVTAKKFDFNNVVACYEYRNGTSKLRDKNKRFLWQHKKPDGTWETGRGKAPHILYLAGEPRNLICVTEGEKDALNLSELGFCCVSSENGAGTTDKKWVSEYTTELIGKDCVLFPDNDTTGQEFMQFVAAQLSGKASSVKMLNLMDIWQELPEKGDISDVIAHFGAEKTKNILSSMIEKTPEWMPFEAPEEDIFSSFGFYTVPDLTEAERKPPDFIVDDMLPIGITFLSGAPQNKKEFHGVTNSNSGFNWNPVFRSQHNTM